jgi:FkbM family methyltransferase
MTRLVMKPTRTFSEFFNHMAQRGFSPKMCIDVGAANGTQSIYDAFPDAYHIAFEPLPDFHEDLSRALASYRHEIHHVALMDSQGSRTLARHPDRYGSSLMHRSKEGASNLVNVPVTTLDEIMKDHNMRGDVLLKIDCQGADLFVLKGGRRTLKNSNVVIVEASFFKFRGKEHPDFFEIINFMKDRGFVVYDILDGLFRPLDGALGQVDLAFVKEGSRFRSEQYW